MPEGAVVRDHMIPFVFDPILHSVEVLFDFVVDFSRDLRPCLPKTDQIGKEVTDGFRHAIGESGRVLALHSIKEYIETRDHLLSTLRVVTREAIGVCRGTIVPHHNIDV
jgi:hypothetical protein